MTKPIKPTIPLPPLRSQPSTFSTRAEASLLAWPIVVDYMRDAVDFVDDVNGGRIIASKFITDCNGLTINGFYYFSAGVLNGPKEGRDGRLIHVELNNNQWSQIAITSGNEFWFRDNDLNNMPTAWMRVILEKDITTAKIIAKVAAATGDNRLPASAIRDLPTGGNGGGLTSEQARGLIADWAEQGNDDKIPLIKFTLSSTAEALAGVSLTALMTPLTTRSAMNAFVPTWARVGNAAKLPVDKIADRSVTGSKLALSTITGTNLANNIITERKLAIGSVTTFKIVDRAVTRNKIADDAVGSAQIGDGTLTAAKFAAGTLLRGEKGDTGDAGSGTGGGLTTTAVRGLIKDFAEVGSSARIASGDIGDDAVIPQKMPLDRQFLLYRASAATLVDLDSKITDLSIRPNSSGLYTYDSTAENQPDDDMSGGVMLSTRDTNSAGTTTGTGSRQVILTNDNNIYYRTGDAFTSFPRPFVKFTGDTTASQVFSKMEAVLRARADDALGVRIDSITTTSNSWIKRVSTSTQLLTDSFVNVPFQTLESDNSGTDITYLNGKFTAVEAGSYMFGGFISIRDTAGQRAQAEIQYYLDDVAHGKSHLGGYIRNAGGSPKWTIAIPAEPFLLTAGQTIELRIKNASDSVSTNVLGVDSKVWFVRMTGDKGKRGLRGLPGEGTATDLTAVNQTLSDHTRFINRNRDDVATVVTRADALEEVDQALTTRVDEDRVRLNELETRETADETVVNRLRKIIGGGGVINMGAINEGGGRESRYILTKMGTGAGNSVRGFCVDPYYNEVFTLHTTSSKNVLNLFNASGARTQTASKFSLASKLVGGQSLDICWDRSGSRWFWTSASSADPNRGRFVRRFRVDVRGTTLAVLTPQLYQLFNTASSVHSTVCCSLDGRFLVAAGNKTGSNVDIKVFDLQKLMNNGAGDYSDDELIKFRISGTYGPTNTIKGMACDGSYIYIVSGNGNVGLDKTLLIYNMDGIFIHEIGQFVLGKNTAVRDSPINPTYDPGGFGWVWYDGKPYLGFAVNSNPSGARKTRVWVSGLPYSERSVTKTWEFFNPRGEDGVIWENARANTIQTPNFESGFDYRIDGEMSISASGSIFVEAFYHIQQAWITVEVLSNVSIVGRVGIHMHWHNPNSDSTIKTGFLEWFQRSQLISKNNPSAKRTIAMTAARGSLERINKIRFRVSDDDESFNTGLLHMTRSRVDG